MYHRVCIKHPQKSLHKLERSVLRVQPLQKVLSSKANVAKPFGQGLAFRKASCKYIINFSVLSVSVLQLEWQYICSQSLLIFTATAVSERIGQNHGALSFRVM